MKAHYNTEHGKCSEHNRIGPDQCSDVEVHEGGGCSTNHNHIHARGSHDLGVLTKAEEQRVENYTSSETKRSNESTEERSS